MGVASIVATVVFASTLALAPNNVLAVDGLITRSSAYPVDATIERFEAAVKRRGFIVFARLDHSAAADALNMKMPRATVIVFGNPRLGTPVFIKTPTVAIDLPPKAMVWEDAEGKVYLSYNSSDYLYGTIYVRHGIRAEKGVVDAVESALSSIADETVK